MTNPSRWPARLPDPIPVYAGDSFRIKLTFADDAGQPLNVTGWGTWQAQARTTAAADKALSFTVDLTNAATGVVELRCSATESEKLRTMAFVWYFDVQTTDGDGVVTTRMRGSLAVDQDVTR